MAGETHRQFLKLLDASQPAVLRMAGELSRLGRWVLIPPFDEHAKTREEALDYVDVGDLFIVKRPEQLEFLERIRCEAKGQTERQGAWSGADDYGVRPGRDDPLDKFFVCSLPVWERSKKSPAMHHFFLNHTWTHYAHVRHDQVDEKNVFQCRASRDAVLEDTKALWVPTTEVTFRKFKEDEYDE